MTKSYPKERLPIRFKRILLNEGNHYNATTGKFVCSVPGVYYFTYDITLANKHLAIGLVHNGQYKIKTFDANTGNHDVASGSTVLRLERQDQVWLQIFYSEQNGLFYDPFWTDSLFTGFLIYADQEYLNEVDRKANEDSSPSSWWVELQWHQFLLPCPFGKKILSVIIEIIAQPIYTQFGAMIQFTFLENILISLLYYLCILLKKLFPILTLGGTESSVAQLILIAYCLWTELHCMLWLIGLLMVEGNEGKDFIFTFNHFWCCLYSAIRRCS